MSRANTESYHTLVSVPCSVRKAINFQTSNMQPMGVITSWEFTNSKKKLDADIPVSDPNSPELKIKGCAVIENIEWEGHPADPLILTLRVTSPNRGALKSALSALDGGVELALQWQVWEYDTAKETHYESFKAEKPINFFICKQTKIEISGHTNSDIDEPKNYTVYMTLTGDSKKGDQEVALASDCDTKYNRPIGTNASA